jgi:hypothetical protein
MKVKVYTCFLVLLALFLGCKKAEERACIKAAGEYSELEFSIDSVSKFTLNKYLKYRIYQDNQKKIIIKGGKNVVSHVEILQDEQHEMFISNNNTCNFFRNNDEVIEVEIHYPYLSDFLLRASDSVIFENTVETEYLNIIMEEGGGSLRLDIDVFQVVIIVANGAGDFNLTGKASNKAELKVQNNGTGNAAYFNSPYFFLYQNSTADMFVNLNKADALVLIDGTGDVYYLGNPKSIQRNGVGKGKVVELQ